MFFRGIACLICKVGILGGYSRLGRPFPGLFWALGPAFEVCTAIPTLGEDCMVEDYQRRKKMNSYPAIVLALSQSLAFMHVVAFWQALVRG